MECDKYNLTKGNMKNGMWQVQCDKCSVTNAAWQIQCDKFNTINKFDMINASLLASYPVWDSISHSVSCNMQFYILLQSYTFNLIFNYTFGSNFILV